MVRRCPSCGIENSLGRTSCERCNTSLIQVMDRETNALANVRIFAILVITVSAIGSVWYVLDIIGYGPLRVFGFRSIFNNHTVQEVISGLSRILVFVEVFLVSLTVLQEVSMLYLRSSFVELMKGDFSFSTPRTGMNLLLGGLIGLAAGIAVLFAFTVPLLKTLQTNPSAVPLNLYGGIALAGILTAIGGIIVLIGYIIGVFLGMHRFADRFEESLFDYSWITYLISIFFIPLGIVAGILALLGVRVTVKRISSVKETVSNVT